MKKYIISFIAVLSVLSFNSCMDLERTDSSTIQLDNFLKNENDLKLYVYSLYKPFGSSNGDADVWGFYATLDAGYYSITENTTDILTTDKSNTNATSTLCNRHSWQLNSNNIMNPLAGKYFPKVNHLSKARMAYIRIQETDLPNKEKYAAEAQAIIGWTGMILYDMFGPVPFASDEQLIKWDANPQSGEWLPKPTDEAFLNYLIDNMEEAIPLLPETQNDWGRITKGAARMLLLRIYLMKGDFQNAKPVAKDLYEMGIESGIGSIYRLEPSYQNVFSISNEKNKELILAIPCDGTKDYSPNQWYCAAMPSDYVHISPYATGSSTHRMRWDFYDTYEPHDERLNTIVASYANNKGVTKDRNNGLASGAIPFKYDQDPSTNGNFSRNDIPVFRYAEAILIYAETIFETEGITSQAISLVNQVRSRAGLSGIETIDGGIHVSSPDAFREAILLERGHELYCEGVRHMDLIRHGKWAEYGKRGLLTADASAYNDDPNRYVFPIDPQVVIDSKGIIEQNVAYR